MNGRYRYVVIDPGETNGLAVFGNTGLLEHSTQISGIVLMGVMLEKMLERETWERILYETYIVNPKISQGGSEVPSAQVIGIIKFLGDKFSTPVEGIHPRYKIPGYAWSGIKKPGNHSVSHAPDAVALGEYWLRKHKIKPMQR